MSSNPRAKLRTERELDIAYRFAYVVPECAVLLPEMAAVAAAQVATRVPRQRLSPQTPAMHVRTTATPVPTLADDAMTTVALRATNRYNARVRAIYFG